VSQPDRSRPDRDGPLLSQRAALVFLLAALAGLGAAVLAALAGNPWPVAVGVGGGAAGSSVVLFKDING
jgi:hypothetical protein